MISPGRGDEISRFSEELRQSEKQEVQRGCSEQNRKQEQSQDFRYDCENFAGIAKISQS